MTLGGRVLGQTPTRSERARARRARVAREVEPVAREPRTRRASPRRPRRRYDLALPVAVGAEVRLPALPVVHLGPRLLSAGLLALTVFGLQYAFNAPGFRIGQASVFGDRILSAPQARSIAAVEGKPIFLVDPEAIARRLAAHPEVASARVSAQWPNRVSIDLTERHPMVEWVDGGKTWWICADGVAYLQHGTWPGLVRVVSPTPALSIRDDPMSPVISPDVMRAAAVLSAQMPQAAELLYDPVHGLGFKDPGGWTAYFGVEGDMTLKVRVYTAIAQKLQDDRARVSVVDVEDSAAPYYAQTR